MPCVYIDGGLEERLGLTRSVAITAPIAAYEEERPFADVRMSGRMS